MRRDVTGVLRWFVDGNVALSRRFMIRNMGEYGAHVEYLRLAALLFSAPDVTRVADIAAGSHWHFPAEYKRAYGLELSGVDIDAAGIDGNAALDFRYVGDVCATPVLGAGGYDLLTCYSGIEHFSDVERFLGHAFASLRPGGAVIAQFPSPLAPFALLNRAIPEGLKRRLLHRLFPAKVREIGYPVHYDKCRYRAFRAAAERQGFKVEYYLPSFMSSDYFKWLFPLFVVSQAVDILRLVFGSRDCASYNLFVLRRPGEYFPIKWSWHRA